MMPNNKTEFLPFVELATYCGLGYFCCAIVFSPETENSHFPNCPPYIALCPPDAVNTTLFFEVPDAIAYYGKQHAGYTMAGRERAEQRGYSRCQSDLRDLLGIKDND